MTIHILYAFIKFHKINQAADWDNTNFRTICENLSSVGSDGDEVELTGVSLDQLMPADRVLSRFFRYKGSLTTPSCDEVVTWTVLEKKITMSEAQVKLLIRLNIQMNFIFKCKKFQTNFFLLGIAGRFPCDFW